MPPNQSQQMLLQALMSHGILNESDLFEILEQCCVEDDIPLEDQKQRLVSYVRDINEAVGAFGLRIKEAVDEVDATAYYCLVNSQETNFTILSSIYTQNELEFYKKLVESIITSDNGNIGSMAAVNISDSLSKKMSKSGAEDLIERFIQRKWLGKTKKGHVYLGCRSIVELDQYLRTMYEENVSGCDLCKSLCTQGSSCDKCDIKIHYHCARKYFKSMSNKTCPRCKAVWNGDIRTSTANIVERQSPTTSSKIQTKPLNESSVIIISDESSQPPSSPKPSTSQEWTSRLSPISSEHWDLSDVSSASSPLATREENDNTYRYSENFVVRSFKDTTSSSNKGKSSAKGGKKKGRSKSQLRKSTTSTVIGLTLDEDNRTRSPKSTVKDDFSKNSDKSTKGQDDVDTHFVDNLEAVSDGELDNERFMEFGEDTFNGEFEVTDEIGDTDDIMEIDVVPQSPRIKISGTDDRRRELVHCDNDINLDAAAESAKLLTIHSDMEETTTKQSDNDINVKETEKSDKEVAKSPENIITFDGTNEVEQSQHKSDELKETNDSSVGNEKGSDVDKVVLDTEKSYAKQNRDSSAVPDNESRAKKNEEKENITEDSEDVKNINSSKTDISIKQDSKPEQLLIDNKNDADNKDKSNSIIEGSKNIASANRNVRDKSRAKSDNSIADGQSTFIKHEAGAISCDSIKDSKKECADTLKDTDKVCSEPSSGEDNIPSSVASDSIFTVKIDKVDADLGQKCDQFGTANLVDNKVEKHERDTDKIEKTGVDSELSGEGDNEKNVEESLSLDSVMLVKDISKSDSDIEEIFLNSEFIDVDEDKIFSNDNMSIDDTSVETVEKVQDDVPKDLESSNNVIEKTEIEESNLGDVKSHQVENENIKEIGDDIKPEVDDTENKDEEFEEVDVYESDEVSESDEEMMDIGDFTIVDEIDSEETEEIPLVEDIEHSEADKTNETSSSSRRLEENTDTLRTESNLASSRSSSRQRSPRHGHRSGQSAHHSPGPSAHGSSRSTYRSSRQPDTFDKERMASSSSQMHVSESGRTESNLASSRSSSRQRSPRHGHRSGQSAHHSPGPSAHGSSRSTYRSSRQPDTFSVDVDTMASYSLQINVSKSGRGVSDRDSRYIESRRPGRSGSHDNRRFNRGRGISRFRGRGNDRNRETWYERPSYK